MRFDPVKILTAGDMSTASLSSIGLDLQQVFGFAIQAVFTGSPVGTLKLQISCDIVQVASGSDPSANVTNWTDYTGSSVAVSAAGNFTWNVESGNYRWIRMVYTKTSGTGSLDASYFGKGV